MSWLVLRHRGGIMWGVAALALLTSSCGTDDVRLPVFPAQGKALYQGQPMVHALVVLHPLNEAEMPGVRPSGRVAADGSFVLSTYTENDGAPAGEYLVTIEWYPPRPEDEEADVGPDRLEGRYSNPKTSGLRCTIKEGTNEIPPFEL
ncbi:MAG: hypothetical protein NZ700_17995 [Gemmataceae bacterium]|nr:hypothetical protein [Gemmataceae bacterium]MDW8267123.1 hypothetical protein [Gemmataceae bacterium]